MKRVSIGVSLILAVIAAAGLYSSRAQVASSVQAHPPSNVAPPTNPLKVALLKWFPAYKSTAFPVGKNPLGLAFDGANMWVANQDGNSVTKLRANDGENLGTFPVQAGPTGIVFDGANIWTVNSYGNNVSKLRASDGKTLGTFNVGNDPLFAAFDGENIWVTNQSGSVSKLRA